MSHRCTPIHSQWQTLHPVFPTDAESTLPTQGSEAWYHTFFHSRKTPCMSHLLLSLLSGEKKTWVLHYRQLDSVRPVFTKLQSSPSTKDTVLRNNLYIPTLYQLRHRNQSPKLGIKALSRGYEGQASGAEQRQQI